MANVLISGSLRLSTTNTPTRIGDVVETVSDIYNIPTPYIGQVVYVTEADEYYYVSELQAAASGFGSIPNAKVKTFKPFSSSDLESRVYNLEIVTAGIKVKSIKDDDKVLALDNQGQLSSTLSLKVQDNKLTLLGKNNEEISSVELSLNNNYTAGDGIKIEDNTISLDIDNEGQVLYEDGKFKLNPEKLWEEVQ